MPKVKTFDEAVLRYGPIVNGKWAGEPLWMDMCQMPDWVATRVLGPAGTLCKRMYMNKDMIPAFLEALDNVKTRGLDAELKTIDGCFNIRLVRGSTSAQSAHSYGLAVDMNAPENPLGGPVTFSREFLQCFKDAGFSLGADFKRVDGMHVSFCWE